MKLLLASDLPIGQALFSSLLGIGIVFVALIALMAVIVLLSKAMKKKNSVSALAEQPPVRPAPPSLQASPVKAPDTPKTLALGSAGPLILREVEEKDAAMLMAIVAYQMKKPLNKLRFISIKQVYDTGENK